MNNFQNITAELGYEPLIYFLSPDDVLEKFSVFKDVFNLASLCGSTISHATQENTKIIGLEYDRGTVVLEMGATGYHLEIFSFDLDDVNASNVSPEFLLTRSPDDSTWAIEAIPFMESQDVIQRFEYLTDIFYMDARMLYTMASDSIIYEGKEQPEEFTEENVNKIFKSHEDTVSA